MKLILESTSKVVTLVVDGHNVSARIWEGHTAESNIPVHCYITRVAVDENKDCTQFEAELKEHRKPSFEIEAIPLRLIL